MTDDKPRASTVKVTLAVLASLALTFYGCSLTTTDGRNYDGRGSWELVALSSFVVAGMLAVYCYRLAFKTRPAFAIYEDRIEHFSWKTPIYFRDVDQIVFEPSQFWMRRSATVALRLKSGAVQYLPYGLMTHGPAAFADLLNATLDQYRASAADGAGGPAPSPVTGP